jgi:hypothetical protein
MPVQGANSMMPDNRLGIIELLINKGARVNDADSSEQTALWWTC